MTTYRRNGEPDGMAEAMAAIAAGAPNAPVQTVAVPFENDQTMQESINELRDKDAEYALLTSDDARKQWENITRANLQSKQRQQQLKEESAAAHQASMQSDILREHAQLTQRSKEIEAALPADVINSPRFQSLSTADQTLELIRILPTGLSGEYVKTLQALDNLAKRAGVPGYEEMAQQLTQQPQPQPQPTPQPSPQVTPEPTQANSLAEYWANEQAKTFGFSNKDEMLQWGQQMSQFREDYQDSLSASQFLASCPDFPNTVEASENIAAIISANNWKWDLDSMQAAHALAVQRHLYQPLSPEAQQASIGIGPQNSRPAPPPMVHSQNPENYVSNIPIEQMTSQQARAEYFRLLNEQKAGQYR